MKKRKLKKRQLRRKSSLKKNPLFMSLTRPELWIGIATVLVVFGLLSKVPFKSITSSVSSYRVMIVKVTPVPTISGSSVAAPTAQPPQEQPTNTPRVTTQEYVIQENDSYFTATEKVCGVGTYYTYNQELNFGKALQIGDTITIRCDWE